MDITKLLEMFFANSKTNVMFVVGVLVLAAGLLGKVVTKKEDDRWRTLAVVFGASLMVLGPVFSFLGSQSTSLPALLKNNLAVIFVVALGVWAFAGAVLMQVQLRRLVSHERRLIANVEDATRHVLVGVPQIFDRAYQLIKQADNELWIITFALNFGYCHKNIPAVATEYSKLPITDSYRTATKNKRRNMTDDVKDFLAELRLKVVDIPKVRILTLFDNTIEDSFLTPLAGRPGYSEIFTTTETTALYGEIQKAKAGIMERLQSRDKDRDENENCCGLYQAESLPLQLFIAGIRGKARSGCLVFMVGTEILEAAKSKNNEGDDKKSERQDKPFQEPGFYTELTEVVDVYRSLAEALFTQAKKQSKPERSVVVYEGR